MFFVRVLYLFFFFFSSRRRHTRCSRDWSSDVCSSDLRIRETLGGRVGPLPAEPLPALLPMNAGANPLGHRSEEHTSELQSRLHLVCRLLLEKKKQDTNATSPPRVTLHASHQERQQTGP